MECEGSYHHDVDNTTQKLTERHFPRSMPPTEEKYKATWRCGSRQHKKIRQTVCSCQICDVSLCVDRCFEACLQGKIIEVMEIACILSAVYRKLPIQVSFTEKIKQKLFEIKMQAHFNGFE